jgi:hypothetical protein
MPRSFREVISNARRPSRRERIALSSCNEWTSGRQDLRKAEIVSNEGDGVRVLSFAAPSSNGSGSEALPKIYSYRGKTALCGIPPRRSLARLEASQCNLGQKQAISSD